tara:strand:- start:302 stop:586 length:285 start_codon:yes stop_codon:yes gene_type:complete
MEVIMDINYTTAELKMCQAYARLGTPQDFREMYDHMCDVAKPYGYNHPEFWVNKMTAKTIKIWEANNAPKDWQGKEASDILNDMMDSQIKHSFS